MPVITPMQKPVPLEYEHKYDRLLIFEDDMEFSYIQLAAQARIACRKAHVDKPFENDEYIAGLEPPISSLYANREWLEQCGHLLDDYIERGYDYVPPTEPHKKRLLRDKVAAFARDLSIANQVFEESGDVEAVEMFADFWRE